MDHAAITPKAIATIHTGLRIRPPECSVEYCEADGLYTSAGAGSPSFAVSCSTTNRLPQPSVIFEGWAFLLPASRDFLNSHFALRHCLRGGDGSRRDVPQ